MEHFSKFLRRKIVPTPAQLFQSSRTVTSVEVLSKEALYHANNFKPIPVAVARGQGKYIRCIHLTL